MRIRNKILIYFSSFTILITSLLSLLIYVLFSQYREEEFQQRQKEKIIYTIGLVKEYNTLSEKLTDMMDKLTIHDFYNEKMLIYDKNKSLIYESIDDLPVLSADQLLNELSPANQWIETKEGKYDIIAVYIQNNHDHFYAISKAYDAFGYTKLNFLKKLLITITLVASLVVVLLSVWISRSISKPIATLAEKVVRLDLTKENVPNLNIQSDIIEIQNLINKINQLIQKTNEAFGFQKHAVHHMAHQLKTPLAVLVSDLEQLSTRCNAIEQRDYIRALTEKVKNLGNVIHALLEISKIDAGHPIKKERIRIDEVLFDTIAELNIIHPEFRFEVDFLPENADDDKLYVNAHLPLIKQAFLNILSNSIAYSDNTRAGILIDCTRNNELQITVLNSGPTITPAEEKYLFHHFFRGQNSKEKNGFGLGLVLVKKILEVHRAQITYRRPAEHINAFVITFTLS